MEAIIKTILYNNNFIFNEEINGFQEESKSYYFVKKIDSDQLEQVRNKTILNESEWYREFLTHFNQSCSKENYPALEKNSSLIVLVNSANIAEIERLQTQILLIEEDQFYVKKYVIVYTSDALEKISNYTSNEELQGAVNNKIAFQNILSNGLSKEQEDYLLLLQIFIKLPFLTLKFNEDEFITLEEKLKKKLGDDYSIFQELLKSDEQIQNLDFSSIENESEINNLLTLLTNDPN
ncbi:MULTISPECIES: ABC-three component system middle component 1 [unclassified Sphingobacterium]|uniref:ABC-three component system middle component 1 n=1 Tax=unclassified Sphingobacterium TaxID=2609468 RepID=UPI0020C4AD3B|nr:MULTISPECIES: ABC-three component system middle component 1 [unclassified Sphingobacterium]